MTTTEQETLKASVIYDAQNRLKASLTKNPNRAVTTEHIRTQTQDGAWYDRNTYQLPLFAQRTLRNVMTVMHEAHSDGIHRVPEMAEVERYTVHRNPTIRGTQTSGTKHTYSYHKQPKPAATTTDGCNTRPYRRNGPEVRMNASTNSSEP